MIRDPFTVGAGHHDRRSAEAHPRTQHLRRAGGRRRGQLVGIVTSRDMRFEKKLDDPVRHIMTKKDRLVTVKEGASRRRSAAAAAQAPHREGAGGQRRLRAARPDHRQGHPEERATTRTRPRTAASACWSAPRSAWAATPSSASKRWSRRASTCMVVDTAHGHSQGVLDRVRWVKKHFPKLQVIGGNIVTGDAALALMDAGADAVKVGVGPGSICTTRIVAGVGVPQITAVDMVAEALQDRIPLIADGGIRYSGDIGKALVAGASTRDDRRPVRRHRGSAGRNRTVPGPQLQELSRHGLAGRDGEGIEGPLFPGRQPTPTSSCPKASKAACRIAARCSGIVHQLAGGLRATMGYVGCATIEEMRAKPKFVQVTAAGTRESHVHDVQITKEPPNYRAIADNRATAACRPLPSRAFRDP